MTGTTPAPDTLRKLPLFSRLSDSELACVLPAVKQMTYPAKACILRAGETPDGLYLIVSGRARVVHEDDEGHALIAADLAPHDFFGEMGLIDAVACPASVRAVEACSIVHLPRHAFVECIERSPSASLYMLRAVIDRLCGAHRKLADLALMSVYERVARVLLEDPHEVDGVEHVRAGAEEIAARVGASREMVSRVVKKMIAQGLVRRYKRKLVVTDRAGLGVAAAGTPSASPAG